MAADWGPFGSIRRERASAAWGRFSSLWKHESALWTQAVFVATGRLKGGNRLAQGRASAAPWVRKILLLFSHKGLARTVTQGAALG